MKAYTYSEARENFASVLEEAERDGAVEIRRRDGAVFRLSPAPKSKSSPLDVPGVKIKVSTEDLVAAVREGRERSPR
jgi:antitoxin (DNA-binding transcriptional repressor) of toxin-antitoxin stability system